MVRNTIGIGGAVIFWNIGEFSDREKLRGGLASLGREGLTPEPRTMPACLRDALEDLYQERHGLLIRPLAKKNGFAIMAEERGTDTNTISHVCTSKVEEDGAISLSPFDYEKAAQLKEKFDKYMGMVRPSGVSQSLVKALASLGGQRLRPGGSIYWLPGDRIEAWSQIASVVEGAACNGSATSIYRIEHDMDGESIRAVRDAVIEEVAAASARIKDEILNGNLGERAMETRQRQAEELRLKVEQYERLLGQGLESCKQIIDEAANAEAAAIILSSGME